MGAVLFVDLEDARVLGVAGGENLRRLTLQENCGVSAAAVDHATDDDHGRRKARGGNFARRAAGKMGPWRGRRRGLKMRAAEAERAESREGR
jgi:hypothetical protein